MVIDYPGAQRPDRFRHVGDSGLRIAVYEWGDEAAPPLFLAHGGFDFAGTFDVFAPLLADGGWRVISWDHRGHGDSEHAALYSWDADIRDAVAVMNSVTRKPAAVLGHSKGGALLLQLADAAPHRISRFVNIDGLPAAPRQPDVASHQRTRMLSTELAAYLDNRRTIGDFVRKPGTIDELAARRGRMNPRLPHDWLRYLVTIGAREDEDGWRWKIDPMLQMGGFGPWRHAWSLERLAGLGMPLLGILGLIPEQMGWGTHPDQLRPYAPRRARLHAFPESGHFVHIEKPKEVAALVLEFLA